jgi:hypothetical protein
LVTAFVKAAVEFSRERQAPAQTAWA